MTLVLDVVSGWGCVYWSLHYYLENVYGHVLGAECGVHV